MRNVFLLGSKGDIGQAILKKFKMEGCNVIAPSHAELDLENIDAIDKFFEKNKDLNIGILVHCAGYNEPKLFEELTIKDIEKTNAINFIGFCKVVQHIIPYMKKKKEGYIVAISSLYGMYSRVKRAAYAMSKHALNGLIETLALELGPFNIKANIVSPGFVYTKMTIKNNPSEVIKSLEEKIPLGRLAKPEDIANVVFFLCSKENNYINGANIVVDGGYSAGGFQK
uniref:SDR family oxidoreductase n=1 Tax=candidate division CPR3 bacterium TaxID=2268181 RepID=A0A7V3J9H2_UNCC3